MSAPTGGLFQQVEVALPVRARRAAAPATLPAASPGRLTGEERLPYTLAIHRGESTNPDKQDNPHMHLVIS